MLSDEGLLGIPDRKRSEILKFFQQVKKSSSLFKPLSRLTKGVLAFFEPSTRTLASFEMAGHDLGIRWMRLNPQDLSLQKGESLKDTFLNLNLYEPDFYVVRHSQIGLPHLVQSWTQKPVFNAGDGQHEHPTQALADAMTLWEAAGEKRLQIAFFGDVYRSRVARSDLKIFRALGHRISIVDNGSEESRLFAEAFELPLLPRRKLSQMQAVICLRTQKERGSQKTSRATPLEISDLSSSCLLLHPAPVIVGEDLRFDLLEERREKNLILSQARNAYLIRRFLLSQIKGGVR